MTSDALLKPTEPTVPQIIHVLRHAIIEMRLQPGEALSEKEIAARFGVSRQPVREAFIKLAEAGLLQILPNRGTYVVKISVREVLNARFVREAIECAIVRSAASVVDDAGLARLEQLIGTQKQAANDGDTSRFYMLDEAFHRAIADIVECEYAIRVVEGARAQTDRVRYLSLPDASPLDLLITQHEAILAGLRQHDPAAAEEAMRVHLREILSAIPRLAERFPDLFDATTVPVHVRKPDPVTA